MGEGAERERLFHPFDFFPFSIFSFAIAVRMRIWKYSPRSRLHEDGPKRERLYIVKYDISF